MNPDLKKAIKELVHLAQDVLTSDKAVRKLETSPEAAAAIMDPKLEDLKDACFAVLEEIDPDGGE